VKTVNIGGGFGIPISPERHRRPCGRWRRARRRIVEVQDGCQKQVVVELGPLSSREAVCIFAASRDRKISRGRYFWDRRRHASAFVCLR